MSANKLLPVIQKTKDGKLVHIDEHSIERKGNMEPITQEEFRNRTHNMELITWDGAGI